MKIEEVRSKLLERGYKLLDDNYSNNKIPMNIEKDGYNFFISWNGIIKTENPKKWGINNPYSIENLKLYIRENNFKCDIISNIYNTYNIKLRCECGNVYECSTQNFILKKQDTCPTCSNKRGAKKHIKNIYLDTLKKFNLTPIEKYNSCKNSIYCKTKEGYILKIIPYNIQKGSNTMDSVFDKNNKYALYNIKIYIQLHNLDVELLSTEYNGTKQDVELRCKCGEIFKTNMYYFLKGNKCLCNKCAYAKSGINKTKYNVDIFEKYGLKPTEEYRNTSTRIYCIDDMGYYVFCSVTSLIANNNPNSTIFHKCNKYILNNIKTYIKNNDLDIELLSTEYALAKDKLKFKCSCGNIFYNYLYDFRKGIGQKCKGCGKISVKSKMEIYVKKYLDFLGVENYSEKTFLDCKDKYMLPFDFYLPKYNILIECQGIQHYKPIEFFGGEEKFKYTQKHDKIKREYCLKNNITLIQISYIDFKNNKIKEIINNYIKI